MKFIMLTCVYAYDVALIEQTCYHNLVLVIGVRENQLIQVFVRFIQKDRI